jgi:hypothetical protein
MYQRKIHRARIAISLDKHDIIEELRTIRT